MQSGKFVYDSIKIYALVFFVRTVYIFGELI